MAFLEIFHVFQQPRTDNQWRIFGDDCQILEVQLLPNHSVISEPGVMCYGADGVKQKTGTAGFVGAIGGALGGESIFRVTHINESNQMGFVGLTPNIPGTIVPLDMRRYPRGFLCRKGAWMASLTADTKVNIGFNPAASLAAACCSNLSLIMQRIEGGSWAFIAAHGTIIQKDLAPNESILVDSESILALSAEITLDVEIHGNCCTACCTGENLCLAKLIGPGQVILQSMPIHKMRELFRPAYLQGEKREVAGQEPTS